MHPGIIKSVFKSIRLFNFNFISSDDMSKIITSLDSTKKASGAIPTKIVKLANKIFVRIYVSTSVSKRTSFQMN